MTGQRVRVTDLPGTQNQTAEATLMNTPRKVKTRKKIFSVQVATEVDTDPDTSYYGEYSNKASSEYSIDRDHSLDCRVNTGEMPDNLATHDLDETGICRLCDAGDPTGVETPKSAPCPSYNPSEDCDCGGGRLDSRELPYFNPSSNYVDKHGNPLPGETTETVRKYVLQDYNRMEDYNRGGWCYVGIRAKAQVGISLDGGKTHKLDTLTPGGVWGIESDMPDADKEEIKQEQLAELKDYLLAYGFGRSKVEKAIREAEEVDA